MKSFKHNRYNPCKTVLISEILSLNILHLSKNLSLSQLTGNPALPPCQR